MSEIFYNLFGGFFQGLTEFLPISSSGHLLLLGIDMDTTIILHFGTVFSILIYYKKFIIENIKQFINGDRKLLYFVIIGCLPISIVGFLGKNSIESFFYFETNSFVPPKALIYTYMLTAIFLFLSKNVIQNKQLTFKIVLIVGLLQILALLPGVSRSGITICSLLILGINHKDAIRFSFLMAIPIILGASFLAFLDNEFQYNSLPMLIGFLSSFLFGLLAIYLTNKLLQNKKYWLFSIYCFIISITIFIWNLIL